MSEAVNQVKTAAPSLVLGTARRTQGLEIADVARQLKLSVSQVQALEAGDFDKLPGPVFVRGFIRNYARLLKLDSEAILSSIELDVPPTSGHRAVPPSRDIPMPSEQVHKSWPRYVMPLLLLLIAGLVVYEFYLSGGENAEQKFAQTVNTPVAAPVTAPVAQDQPEASTQSAQIEPAAVVATPSAPVAEAKREQASAATLATNVAPPAQEGAADQPGQSSTQGAHELHLVFTKQSWVEIRDRSGKLLLSRINPPGSEQRVNGMPPFSLIIGNAHSVKLTHNDAPVNLAQHATDDVARFTLK
jgi:cytoskeleton protein RodZ